MIMDKYTRNLFGNKCPYDAKPCNNDIPCEDCTVEQEERRMLQEDEEFEDLKK